MDNINDLLNSISAEDMEKLKSVAASLVGDSSERNNEQSNDEGDINSLIIKVASGLNRESEKTAFLKALKPLLSQERQQKADEAVKFLRLMDTLPLLKGLF